MEDIHLTETEQRYFADLFICCDSDNKGKIPRYKASEFFRSANLPLDVLNQILDLCGGARTSSYFGRRQFYSALKLIAAFQAGLPLKQELFQSPIEVPLPRFTWKNTFSAESWDHNEPPSISPDLIQLNDTEKIVSDQLEYIAKSENMEAESAHTNGGSLSPPVRVKVGSPEASSTASDSPTPTNSVQDKNWVTTSTNHWQSLVCEEQRQLLGTEEESSDRHSSEEDGEGEVWVITDEQRDYYTAQFRSLQPDPAGLIAGPVARQFFEKSRLPVQELRKIWQLADVTKDGALSLDEFNTAMHLVVLRRNNIDLPDSLPSTLVPPPTTAAPLRPPTAELPSGETSPPGASPPAPGEPTSPPRSKEVLQWTKFVDSPTSSVSSPGPKPVNFDFHKSAVEQDPKILHPVPLRVTPETQCLAGGDEEPCRSPRRPPDPSQPIGPDHPDAGSPKKGVDNGGVADIRPIQRPQPKKPAAPGPGAIPPPPQPSSLMLVEADVQTSSVSGPVSLPSGQPLALMGPKKEPPPPPPPRPYRTHTRSSSLDLNRLGKTGVLLGAPPVVPPRVSPSTTSPKKLIGQRSEGDVLSLAGHQPGFADFAQFGHEEESAVDGPQPRRHGAFEVYRKPVPHIGLVEVDGLASEVGRPPLMSIRRLHEQNSLLIRVCHELSQELAEVQEERTALELQLEQLKSLHTE